MADISLIKETITTSNINEEDQSSIALTGQVYEVADETAQLALEIINEGDVCRRTSDSKTYIALNSDNVDMGDWLEITAIGAISSVNGESGVVTLTTGDIGVDTDKNYVTDDDITNLGNLSGENTGDQDLSGYQLISEKGNANGYAELDGDGTIPIDQLPPLAITKVNVVASEVAQLALTVQEGDVAVRTDFTPDKTYIALNSDNVDMSDWQEITASGAVVSVNGESGVVTLTTGDINEDTDKNYVTDDDITNLGNLSGTNTGDQDLSNYVQKDDSFSLIVDHSNVVGSAGVGSTLSLAYDNTNNRLKYVHSCTGSNRTASMYGQQILPDNVGDVTAIRVTTYKVGTPTTFTVTMKVAGSTDSSINTQSVVPTTASTYQTFNFTPNGSYSGGDVLAFEFGSQLNTGSENQIFSIEIEYTR